METTSDQPAAQPPSVDPFADLRDPNNGLILGKYTNADELKRGYWEQNNFIGNLVEQNRDLQGRVNPAVAARQQDSAVDALAKEGMLPAHLLRAAIEEIAGQRLEQAFKPIQDTFQARTRLAESLPEFVTNEAEIMRWAGSQPSLNQQITAMQQGGFSEPALRLATREWQASRVAHSQPTNTAPASLPSGSVPAGAGRTTAPAFTPEDLGAAMQAARSGNDAPLSKMLWQGMNWYGSPETQG
jgi:hypothetical protein